MTEHWTNLSNNKLNDKTLKLKYTFVVVVVVVVWRTTRLQYDSVFTRFKPEHSWKTAWKQDAIPHIEYHNYSENSLGVKIKMNSSNHYPKKKEISVLRTIIVADSLRI